MPTTLPPNWLDLAASKGATKWLKQFIRFYLAQLAKGTLKPEDFADELNQEFASRRLDTDAQQKNYRSNVVQALKILDPEHPAIALVALSTEQYRVLNDAQKERIADRETRFIDDPEAIVALAQRLLDSTEWSDVSAGLAMLIGRRISEILLSEFTLKTPWSLSFSQMAKQAEAVQITLEIPTLAPAARVLKAIDLLQASLGIEDLKINSLTERQARQAVNRQYSHAIADKCEQHFKDLVPTRSDKDNLYTHIFRAVYATIAAHWYCPPNIPEHHFKAEVQGHFTLNRDGKKLPNYGARSNYDDYAIGDGQGNRDGRLGIKLGQVKGLQVIDAFWSDTDTEVEAETETEVEVEVDTNTDTDTNTNTEAEVEVEVEVEKAIATESNDVFAEQETTQSAIEETMVQAEQPMKRPHLYADDLERLTALMAQEGVTGSIAELFHTLLSTYETEKGQQHKAQVETVSEVAQTFNWFVGEIDALRERIATLEEERSQLQTRPSDTRHLEALQKENQQLRQKLQETQKQLDGIHTLLGGGNNSQATPTTAAIATTPAKVDMDTLQPSTQLRDRGGAKAKVEGIINDIISWNTAQTDSDRRLRISVPVIKSLGALVGATYQPVIQQVIEEQQSTIDEVHQRFLIGRRHNTRVDKDSVLQAIARDYMGLENWSKAKYG